MLKNEFLLKNLYQVDVKLRPKALFMNHVLDFASNYGSKISFKEFYVC